MADAGEAPRILVELPASGPDGPLPGVALLTIDRPRVLNALDAATLEELVAALERLEADESCRAVVLTGAGGRAFAAGADIRELLAGSSTDLPLIDAFARWERVRRDGKPLVAAVEGYALGGGCELAMACDLMVAAEDAVFGQPEITLGVIPGAGGTQRLTRALGKARAMDLVLTGRTISAREAEAAGLVSRLVPPEATVPTALELAARIATMPPLAVRAAKRAVDAAFELPLRDGLDLERQAFLDLIGTEDQREGMTAFLEKRPATFRGR